MSVTEYEPTLPAVGPADLLAVPVPALDAGLAGGAADWTTDEPEGTA